jgi:hypothetical protein
VVERGARCNCSGTREKVHWASVPSPEGSSVRCLRYLSVVMAVGGRVSVPSCLWNSTTSLAPAYITTTLRPNTSATLAILSTQHRRGFCSTTLLAFKAAFKKLIIKKNIYIDFRGARLVLYNLEVVILKLNIVLYTLTLLKLENTL